jgi:hypothetical protein
MKHGLLISSLALSILFTGCGGKFHPRSASVPSSPNSNAELNFDGEDEGDESEFELSDQPMEYPALWDGKHPDALTWTRATVTAIERYGQDMLNAAPSDIQSYCPRFKNLRKEEKLAFWVHMISAIAQKESGFDPAKSYEETFANSKGEKVMSRGLLQLSLESANNANYGCRFKTEKELEDPIKNLVCGVKILNHWIKLEPVISRNADKDWYGASKYWGVLRASDTRKFISSKTSDLPICHSIVI